MEWLVVLSLTMSSLNIYFFFKNQSKKSYSQDLEEFRSYTESLITEFNRITTRNVDLLDSRIEELDHKIRLSQKIDLLLKERFEEAHKIEYLKILHLDQIYEVTKKNVPAQGDPYTSPIYKGILPNITESSDSLKEKREESLPLESQNMIFTDAKKDPTTDTHSEKSSEELHDKLLSQTLEIPLLEESSETDFFEGVSVTKIKKYKKLSSQKKQELLFQYISEEKNKEELLEQGFTSNEINIALLCFMHQSPITQDQKKDRD